MDYVVDGILRKYTAQRSKCVAWRGDGAARRATARLAEKP